MGFLILDKSTGDIWCNGASLSSRLSQNYNASQEFEFCITVEDDGKVHLNCGSSADELKDENDLSYSHQCVIHRIREVDHSTFELYVDDCLVEENLKITPSNKNSAEKKND